jgi:hypothetical protein
MPVSWTFADMKRNAPGVILIVAVFAAVLALDPHKWSNDASPIRSVEPVDAAIKSGQGKGRTIQYLLFLENGSAVLVSDDRPRLIGSTIRLERVTHDNGFVFYRFPE